VEKLLNRLGIDPAHHALIGQLLRYAVTGGGVTLLHLGVYSVFARGIGADPLLANVAAQIVSTATGYIVHSRWSFRGHGRRDNLARTGGRFVLVSGFGFALNSLWVWIFTHALGGPFWWPMPAMAVATPLIVFWLNRRWVFG
jgi:putative flippase GtrA